MSWNYENSFCFSFDVLIEKAIVQLLYVIWSVLPKMLWTSNNTLLGIYTFLCTMNGILCGFIYPIILLYWLQKRSDISACQYTVCFLEFLVNRQDMVQLRLYFHSWPQPAKKMRVVLDLDNQRETSWYISSLWIQH